MNTLSLFQSVFVLVIILIAILITLAYLLGKFILKFEAFEVKVFITGLDFLMILILNLLVASSIRLDPVFGNNTILFIGVFSLLVLIIISTQKLRSFLAQYRIISKIIWGVCLFGICLYPIVIFDLSLHHHGDIRRITLVESATFPAFAIFFFGVYTALKFFAAVIYRHEPPSS